MRATKIKIEMSTEIAEIFKIQLLAEFSGRAIFLAVKIDFRAGRWRPLNSGT